MRILFLSQLLPFPLDAGPKLRAYYVLRYLAEAGHRITLLAFSRESDTSASTEKLAKLCESVRTVPLKRSRMKDLRDGMWSLVSDQPFLIVRDRIGPMVRCVTDLARTGSFDAVHADQLWMAPFATQADHKATTVLDQHNAVYQAARRWADVRRDPLTRLLAAREAAKLQRFERSTCRRFDRVVWVSEKDRLAVRGEHPVVKTNPPELVIPIATDPEEQPLIERQLKPFRITFVGGMHWPPNADGIRWFATEVWPEVIRQIPWARLTVIGKRPPAVLQRLNGTCDVVGFAPELEGYLTETAVFVVPLRCGAGMRVKILDAWCWGIPVVSTTLGAEGLQIRAGENMLLGDSAEALASAIVEVARRPELSRRLVDGGRQTIVDHYDWRKVYRRWDEVYR